MTPFLYTSSMDEERVADLGAPTSAGPLVEYTDASPYVFGAFPQPPANQQFGPFFAIRPTAMPASNATVWPSDANTAGIAGEIDEKDYQDIFEASVNMPNEIGQLDGAQYAPPPVNNQPVQRWMTPQGGELAKTFSDTTPYSGFHIPAFHTPEGLTRSSPDTFDGLGSNTGRPIEGVVSQSPSDSDSLVIEDNDVQRLDLEVQEAEMDAESETSSDSDVTESTSQYVNDIKSPAHAREILAQPGPVRVIHVHEDDWEEVKQSLKRYAKRLFDAILVEGIDSPPDGLKTEEQTRFESQQTTSLASIRDLMDDKAKVRLISCHCMLAVETAVSVHEFGVPKEIYDANNGQLPRSRIARLNTKLKCSERLDHMVVAVQEYKKVALDLVSGAEMKTLSYDTEQCIKGKIAYLKSNVRRQTVADEKKKEAAKEITTKGRRAGSKVSEKKGAKGKVAMAMTGGPDDTAGSDADGTIDDEPLKKKGVAKRSALEALGGAEMPPRKQPVRAARKRETIAESVYVDEEMLSDSSQDSAVSTYMDVE